MSVLLVQLPCCPKGHDWMIGCSCFHSTFDGSRRLDVYPWLSLPCTTCMSSTTAAASVVSCFGKPPSRPRSTVGAPGTLRLYLYTYLINHPPHRQQPKKSQLRWQKASKQKRRSTWLASCTASRQRRARCSTSF